MKPQKLTEEQIKNSVRVAIREAVDFIESEVAPDRIKAQKYFDGKSDLTYETGRSKVVATKCRDTVRAIKPALMRVFLQSGQPVEFVPRTPQAANAAEQASKYCEYVFNRNNGFSVLSDVFHDALIKKVGIAKAYYDETSDVEFDEYTGMTEDQIAFLEQEEGVENVEITDSEDGEIDPVTGEMSTIYSAKITMISKRGEIKIHSIAPEDFFVDSNAVSLDDCFICGHNTDGRVGDLVEMGFDFDEVYEYAGSGSGSVAEEEQIARSGHGDRDDDENDSDPSMRKIQITEAYMRMDIEGTGIPRLYKFICAGLNYEMLEYELSDFNPFAIFEVDPEPHTFFGRSIVDIILEDQDASTSLMRGLLDNIAMMNNPRLLVNDAVTDMDDVLNNEIGGVIRTTDMNGVREMVIGSAATSAIPAIALYDEAIRAKTGVSGANGSMDTDSLQNQTATGVNAAVQAATAVSELISRTLAEGGMKQLFKTIAQIARQNPNPDEMMRLDGQFIPVDPRSWGSDLDMMTNVGLGTNKHDEKMMTLQQIAGLQMQVFGQYGPSNGMVSMTNIRNAQADIMAHGGIHNADRYMQPMNAEIEAQLMQQQAEAAAQAQQGQGGDPNAAFLQAEQMKAQTRAQVDMQKAAMEHQRKMLEMANGDDFKRDEMAQKLLVDAAKILGQYGTSVDVAQVSAQQNAPRQYGGTE